MPEVEAEPPIPPRTDEEDTGAGTLATDSRAEPEPCGSRQDMVLSIEEMNDHYDGFSDAILDVNDELPMFRRDVRDIDEVCAPAVENGIASAIRKLRKLDIENAVEVVVGLTTCVDQLRRKTDEEFNAPDVTTIRMQRLSDELQRLTATTHDVQDMERALRRATSKRDRLVDELTQLEREVESSCK